MFGGPLKHPKIDKNYQKPPPIRDITLPNPLTATEYAHFGRAANTDYHVRLLHYKQRHNELINKSALGEANRLLKDKYNTSYEQHVEIRQFQTLVKKKFQQKWKVYEAEIEERRKKLQELYAREEIDYYAETVESCQNADAEKITEIKLRAETLKAQREAERLKIVEQKRQQQFFGNCTDLRPVLIKKNLIETKKVQLEQIKENEKNRQYEKDLKNMWDDLMSKAQLARDECEEHKAQLRRQDLLETQSIRQKQIETKEALLKEQNQRKLEEDNLEMLELQQQIQREQIERLNKKRKQRDQTERDLKQQMEDNKRLLQERQQADQEIDERLAKLKQAELDAERAKFEDTKAIARREAKLYQQYLRELQQERQREEEQFTILLEKHRKSIEEKQERIKCEMMRAKQRLLEDVLKGREEQLELKRQQIENELKLKEADNELLKLSLETNARLQAEHDRLYAENERLYKEEIKQQIEINNQRRKQEKEEMEKEYLAGLEEERRLKQIVEDYKKSIKPVTPHKHPFRRVLDTENWTTIESCSSHK